MSWVNWYRVERKRGQVVGLEAAIWWILYAWFHLPLERERAPSAENNCNPQTPFRSEGKHEERKHKKVKVSKLLPFSTAGTHIQSSTLTAIIKSKWGKNERVREWVMFFMATINEDTKKEGSNQMSMGEQWEERALWWRTHRVTWSLESIGDWLLLAVSLSPSAIFFIPCPLTQPFALCSSYLKLLEWNLLRTEKNNWPKSSLKSYFRTIKSIWSLLAHSVHSVAVKKRTVNVTEIWTHTQSFNMWMTWITSLQLMKRLHECTWSLLTSLPLSSASRVTFLCQRQVKEAKKKIKVTLHPLAFASAYANVINIQCVKGPVFVTEKDTERREWAKCAAWGVQFCQMWNVQLKVSHKNCTEDGYLYKAFEVFLHSKSLK